MGYFSRPESQRSIGGVWILKLPILNDKFQLVALSYGVEFVIEMSTGSSHASDKTKWQAFVCTTT